MNDQRNRTQKVSKARFSLSLICRRGFAAFFVLLFLVGLAQPTEIKTGQIPNEIITNPQANPFLSGTGWLGEKLGLSKESGVRVGGMFIPQFNWTISGGVKPHTTFGGLGLWLNLGVDTQKTLGIPGGTFGVEFVEYTGGQTNGAAGCVQNYDNLNGGAPHVRQELYQLWYHQRLFDDKLILQIGKINATGIFDQVNIPVALNNPKLQDTDITVLTMVPTGYNPTTINRLPTWYNSAYGAVVHLAPTKNLCASYGIFDGNLANGKQTGILLGPRINNYKFQVGELGANWLLGAGQLPGRFGIGGWVQTGKLYTTYLRHQNGATGFYLFANQRLWYRNPEIDNAGLIGYLQFGHTSDHAETANNYVGAGLTAVGLLPVLPYNRVSVGMAWSQLNDGPYAGLFYPISVPSDSTKLRASELMLQVALQWTVSFVSTNIAYTLIPTPGARPNLPAAHALTLRWIFLL
jgi:porin